MTGIDPTRFVALGDSFTEGLGDPYPDGSWRGWADRVAQGLAAGHPQLAYANLAVRGRLVGQIVDEQVPAALTLRPTLVSLQGGTNDMLRPAFDADLIADRLREGTAMLTAAGARVVLMTGGDPSGRGRLARRLLPKVVVLNTRIREIAHDHGAVLVDLWRESWDADALWSEDRLHLSSAGHEKVAHCVLTALGAGSEGGTPPIAGPRPPWVARRSADAVWVRRHFAPWLHRRLTGRSSGDGMACKHPEYVPLGEALTDPARTERGVTGVGRR